MSSSHTTVFKFSEQCSNIRLINKLLDRITYGNPQTHIGFNDWLKPIFMARFNIMERDVVALGEDQGLRSAIFASANSAQIQSLPLQPLYDRWTLV